MNSADYSAITDEFERYVRKHFAYLETEYGFTACSPRTQGLDDPRDAGVSIRYKTDAVSVQIGISLIGAGIGVAFKNENWFDVPKDRRVKWVSLESVIDFRTSRGANALLHELTSSRHRRWPEGFLMKNMEVVIQTLASEVNQHAADIIGGDVSSFADIVAADHR